MRLLQINVTASGSTGKIAEAIGRLAISRGWESYLDKKTGGEYKNKKYRFVL